MVLVVVLLAVGLGIVELVSLPFGGLGLAPGILLGLFVVIAVLGVIAAVGRRRRDAREGRRALADPRRVLSPTGPVEPRAGGTGTTLAPCLRPSA